MKTARDIYPEASDELFDKASEWVSQQYSYVPYMEPARDGFINGWLARQEEFNRTEESLDAGNKERRE